MKASCSNNLSGTIMMCKRNGTLYTGVPGDLPSRVWHYTNNFCGCPLYGAIYYPSFPLRAEKGGALAQASDGLFVKLFYSKTREIA